ncbi:MULTISPECIES: EpsG family protein [unclassified Providencia]|uniref:EpsG family protein n=1 Tax=unclassified Providencia TaxID=2633465 RepID=UPI0028816BCA|nr:EpsG family protein [Providencia rettgeri]
MAAYNVIFFSLLILCIAEKKNLLGNRFIPIFISFIFVLLFTGLRGNVGQDIPNYKEIHKNITLYYDHIEYGFYYLVIFFKWINLDFTFFIFFSSIFFIFLYYYALYKFLGVGLVIFAFLFIFCDLYMYFNMSGIRQGIALSIVLLSGYYAYKRNFIKFIILVFLATLFHKSAIVALLIYPIIKIRIQKHIRFYILLSVISLLWIALFPSFIKTTTLLSDIKASSMYLSDDYNELSISAYLIGIIRRVYPILLFFLFYKKIKECPLTLSLFNVYLFGFIMYLLNYPILQDVTIRISSYFILFEPVLVISILSKITSKKNYLLICSLILSLMYIKILIYSSLPAYQYDFFDTIF